MKNRIIIVIVMSILLSSCTTEHTISTTSTNKVKDIIEHLIKIEKINVNDKLSYQKAIKNYVIVGFGNSDTNSGLCFKAVFIIMLKGEKIINVSENLAEDIYRVCNIKTINIEGHKGEVLYLELSNTANMKGFKIIDFLNTTDPSEIVYSVSATGAGKDNLIDSNNNGLSDGYEQHRWSYDVLYNDVKYYYKFTEQGILLDRTEVDIPNYPKQPLKVAIQYLSLRSLKLEKCLEVDQRLSQINQMGKEIDIDCELWFNKMLDYANGINKDDVEVNTKEKYTEITININDNKKFVIHLHEKENKWSIINIIV